jgi:hypothetical protein
MVDLLATWRMQRDDHARGAASWLHARGLHGKEVTMTVLILAGHGRG